jgi:hypothetical protein
MIKFIHDRRLKVHFDGQAGVMRTRTYWQRPPFTPLAECNTEDMCPPAQSLMSPWLVGGYAAYGRIREWKNNRAVTIRK